MSERRNVYAELQQMVKDEAKRQERREMTAQWMGAVYGHRRALELVEDILVQKGVTDAKNRTHSCPRHAAAAKAGRICRI